MNEENEECVSFCFNPDFSALTFDICEEVDKEELNRSVYDEELYDICSMVERNLMCSRPNFLHMAEVQKRIRQLEINNETKRRKFESGSRISFPTAAYADQRTSGYTNHKSSSPPHWCPMQLNTIKYENTQNVYSSPTNVSVVESAFGQRKIRYKIDIKPVADLKCYTPELLLDSFKTKVMFLIEQCIKQHVIIEVNIVLNAEYSQADNIFTSGTFHSSSYILMEGDDLSVFYSSVCECLVNEVRIFESQHTESSLKMFKDLEVDVVTAIQKLIDNSWHITI